MLNKLRRMNGCHERFNKELQNTGGFPGGSVVKTPPASAGDSGSILGSEIPRRRKWKPTPVFLPGKSHVQQSLVGKPWGLQRVRHDLVTKQQQQRKYREELNRAKKKKKQKIN